MYTIKKKGLKFICITCKMEFANKIQLNRHAFKSHPKKRIGTMKRNQNKHKNNHTCVACKNKFRYNCQLKYHIRKHHFNLIGKVPYCELQAINEVWYEKVLNSDIIVEITKVSNNNLLIRKLNDITDIDTTEMKREVIDLRVQYPTNSSNKIIECRVCFINYNRKDIIQHFVDSHGQIDYKKCDVCKAEFKRLINYMDHVCSAAT